MEKEFLDWFEASEKRFAHGQFDVKQIAYSAWLEGAKQTKNSLDMSEFEHKLDEILSKETAETLREWLENNRKNN